MADLVTPDFKPYVSTEHSLTLHFFLRLAKYHAESGNSGLELTVYRSIEVLSWLLEGDSDKAKFSRQYLAFVDKNIAKIQSDGSPHKDFPERISHFLEQYESIQKAEGIDVLGERGL